MEMIVVCFCLFSLFFAARFVWRRHHMYRTVIVLFIPFIIPNVSVVVSVCTHVFQKRTVLL